MNEKTDVVDVTETKLYRLVDQLRSEIGIKTHYVKLRAYPDTFSASDAITWLKSKAKVVDSTAEATQLLVEMENETLIYSAIESNEPGDTISTSKLYNFSSAFEYSPAVDRTKLPAIEADLRACLPTATRKYRMKQYPNVFVGNEAVDFLVARGHAVNRAHAVAIGEEIRLKGSFSHVFDDHAFKDEFLFYHFYRQ